MFKIYRSFTAFHKIIFAVVFLFCSAAGYCWVYDHNFSIEYGGWGKTITVDRLLNKGTYKLSVESTDRDVCARLTGSGSYKLAPNLPSEFFSIDASAGGNSSTTFYVKEKLENPSLFVNYPCGKRVYGKKGSANIKVSITAL